MGRGFSRDWRFGAAGSRGSRRAMITRLDLLRKVAEASVFHTCMMYGSPDDQCMRHKRSLRPLSMFSAAETLL